MPSLPPEPSSDESDLLSIPVPLVRVLQILGWDGALPLILALVPAQRTATFAQQAGSKEDLTPIFWQRDPDADFEDEGRMHCAPTAVSDGLIYLARANGWKDLVPGTRKKEDQIDLIKELAEEFGTDP